MKNVLVQRALVSALPLILGAIGGWVAATYPAVHVAFCAGKLL